MNPSKEISTPILLAIIVLVVLIAAGVLVYNYYFISKKDSEKINEDANMIKLKMLYRDAAQNLDNAGAKEVEMAIISETETEKNYTYELPDGKIIILSTDKNENTVSSIQICDNPQEPKETRNWKYVEYIELNF